jgi:hypothetical protein
VEDWLKKLVELFEMHEGNLGAVVFLDFSSYKLIVDVVV